MGYCAKCHGLDGGGGYGPRFTGHADEAETVGRVVRATGRNLMPPVGHDWTREQMDSLNAYLEERFGDQG